MPKARDNVRPTWFFLVAQLGPKVVVADQLSARRRKQLDHGPEYIAKIDALHGIGPVLSSHHDALAQLGDEVAQIIDEELGRHLTINATGAALKGAR